VSQPIEGDRDRSLGDLVGEVAEDLSTLVRQELQLARAELGAEARKAGKAGGLLGGAGYAGHMAALFASLAIVFGLGALIPLGWSALVVALVWAVVGAVLYSRGRRELATVNPRPERTIESIKEDVQWASPRRN
jgi:VIT1/CCC1 family predicted Fe2+/Mn2+ transporter